MPTHSTLDIGRRGEDLAADFLSQKGYRIVI
jgi:Holliday junction resolvase-like predicted endonuclease